MGDQRERRGVREPRRECGGGKKGQMLALGLTTYLKVSLSLKN